MRLTVDFGLICNHVNLLIFVLHAYSFKQTKVQPWPIICLGVSLTPSYEVHRKDSHPTANIIPSVSTTGQHLIRASGDTAKCLVPKREIPLLVPPSVIHR